MSDIDIDNHNFMEKKMNFLFRFKTLLSACIILQACSGGIETDEVKVNDEMTNSSKVDFSIKFTKIIKNLISNLKLNPLQPPDSTEYNIESCNDLCKIQFIFFQAR